MVASAATFVALPAVMNRIILQYGASFQQSTTRLAIAGRDMSKKDRCPNEGVTELSLV
jgi:hypothetical protein